MLILQLEFFTHGSASRLFQIENAKRYQVNWLHVYLQLWIVIINLMNFVSDMRFKFSQIIKFVKWGISSIGRVRALQAWGTGIEARILHSSLVL